MKRIFTGLLFCLLLVPSYAGATTPSESATVAAENEDPCEYISMKRWEHGGITWAIRDAQCSSVEVDPAPLGKGPYSNQDKKVVTLLQRFAKAIRTTIPPSPVYGEYILNVSSIDDSYFCSLTYNAYPMKQEDVEHISEKATRSMLQVLREEGFDTTWRRGFVSAIIESDTYLLRDWIYGRTRYYYKNGAAAWEPAEPYHKNLPPPHILETPPKSPPSVPPAPIGTVTITDVIPGHYSRITVRGADPSKPLDRKALTNLIDVELAKRDVTYMQLAVYDKGKKEGNGVRALVERFKNPGMPPKPFFEAANAEQGKIVEKTIGYRTSHYEAFNAYKRNIVVAEEAFNGKTLILDASIGDIAKDASGKPYLQLALDPTMTTGARIYVSLNDPFLRRLRPMSSVILRAVPTGFVNDNIIMKGEVVHLY